MARLLQEHPWTRPLFRALVSCPRALLRAVRAGPDDVGKTIPDSALLHRACGPIFSLHRRPPRQPAGARRTEIASLPPRSTEKRRVGKVCVLSCNVGATQDP